MKIPPLNKDVGPIKKLIHMAVVDRDLSLNQIARMCGLSVPTISRIFYAKSGTVHLRTAKIVRDGLSRTKQKKKMGSKPRLLLTKKQETAIINKVVSVLKKSLATIK